MKIMNFLNQCKAEFSENISAMNDLLQRRVRLRQWGARLVLSVVVMIGCMAPSVWAQTPTGTFRGTGTVADPYLIGTPEELILFSRVTNMADGVTHLGRTVADYNGANYVLDADINMNGNQDGFMPIAAIRNNTTHYSWDHHFHGSFDGRGHTISNLTITWSAGEVNDATFISRWGLFGSVEGWDNHTTTVKNLVLDGIRVNHNIQNENIRNNSIAIGVLAGVVGNYTEISNICILNSSISDATQGSGYGPTLDMYREVVDGQYPAYDAFGIWVGGAIGSVQRNHVSARSSASWGNPVGVTINNIMAEVDITMTRFRPFGAHAQAIVPMSVGGIVGRVIGYDYTPKPNVSMYSGTIDAPRFSVNTLVGKIYRNQVDKVSGFNMSMRQYEDEGRNVNNAFFSNYYLMFNGTKTAIDESYPNGECPSGARTLQAHSHGNYGSYYEDGSCYEVQGVAMGARYAGSSATTSVQEAYNTFNLNAVNDAQYGWVVDQDGALVLIAEPQTPLFSYSIVGTTATVMGAPISMIGAGQRYSISYQWETSDYHENKTATNALAAQQGVSCSVAGHDVIYCHVVLRDTQANRTVADQYLKIVVSNVVYINYDNNATGYTAEGGAAIKTYNTASDANDGRTPETAVRSFERAYEVLGQRASQSMYDNVIVLMGEASTAYFAFSGSSRSTEKMNVATVPATITGRWDGVDYHGVWGKPTDREAYFCVNADHCFQYFTIIRNGQDFDQTEFFGHLHNIHFGKGLVMQGFQPTSNQLGFNVSKAKLPNVEIFGGFNDYSLVRNNWGTSATDDSFPAAELINPYAYGYTGRDTVTCAKIIVESGYWAAICPGNRQTGNNHDYGVLGGPDHPIKADIVIDIDRQWNDSHSDGKYNYDVGLLMAGCHEGTMYADVRMVAKTGKIQRVINGTMGDCRPFYKRLQDRSGIVHVSYDSYFGRAELVVGLDENADVTINELYGGGLGRQRKAYEGGDNTIACYFYGQSLLTVNGGKVESAIYASGAGGCSGIGDDANHTYDPYIPYWVNRGTATQDVSYGDYSQAKATMVEVRGRRSSSDIIRLDNTFTHITINSGQLGSPEEPIDGIFGGGYGLVDNTNFAFTNYHHPNRNAGAVFAGAGKTATTIDINGGVIYGNIYGGSRGTAAYYNLFQNNYGKENWEDEVLNPELYKALACVYGNTVINIRNGAEIHGDVFGGGKGIQKGFWESDVYDQNYRRATSNFPDMAKLYGKALINLENTAKVFGNVYGGGDVANVANQNDLASEINIRDNAQVYGKVYGAGNGRAADANYDYTELGGVVGNCQVTIRDDAYVWGDLYGGSCYGITNGNTRVNILGGSLGGDIFGGSMGDQKLVTREGVTTPTTADISGKTLVYIPYYINNEGGQINTARMVWDMKAEVSANKASVNIIAWDNAHKAAFYDYTNNQFLTRHNIYGGGNIACQIGDSSSVVMEHGLIGQDLLTREEWQKSYDVNKAPHFYLFGAGFGPYTYVRAAHLHARLAANADDKDKVDSDQQLVGPSRSEADITIGIHSNNYGVASATVLGIVGGGYNGTSDSTYVDIAYDTYAHRVFGGSLGSYEEFTRLNGNEKQATLAQVRSAQVIMTGGHINGDVFGGGAGIGTDARSREGRYFIYYPDVARVTGSTYVEVSGPAEIYGSVYGGGDIASVGPKDDTEIVKDKYLSQVILQDGNVYGYVFGGGFGRALADAGAEAFYSMVGRMQGNVFVHVSDKASVWNQIYGGGRNGTVNGNAQVTIDGGNVGHDIYGGGWGDLTNGNITYADVRGNTQVDILGGSLIWDKIATFDGSIREWNKTAGFDPHFYNEEEAAFTISHNIFGGGNMACRVGAADNGTSIVNVRHSLITDDEIFSDKDNYGYKAWDLSKDNFTRPQFYVFGGGYGKDTYSKNAIVNANIGAGEAYKSLASDAAVWTAFNNKLMSEKGAYSAYINKVAGESADTENERYLAVRYAALQGVANHTLMAVVGGGYNGNVGSTLVNIDGHSVLRNVYGGGLGSKDYFFTDPSNEKFQNLGLVEGNTEVNVNGGIVLHSVYGGGAGAEDETVSGTVYNFPEMARVFGMTTVNVGASNADESPYIFDYIYGGGNVANVGSKALVESDGYQYTTNVTVAAGKVFSQVIGGGSGRATNQTKDYTKVGGIMGNTHVVLTESLDKNDRAVMPTLWNNVYGGCEMGIVDGNTFVEVKKGIFCQDIFGGGSGRIDTIFAGDGKAVDNIVVTSADIKGDATVNVEGGRCVVNQLWNVAKRSWASNIINKESGVSSGTPQYSNETHLLFVNHNIYGGGNLACAISGNTHVYMTRGLLDENVTISGRPYLESEMWKYAYMKKGSPNFCVFGAGFGVNTSVKGNTYVDISMSQDGVYNLTMDDAKGVSTDFKSDISYMDVIGGGLDGKVEGIANVHVGDQSMLRRVYGGGYYAEVKGTQVDVTSGRVDQVFGGGLMGDVLENVVVTIGRQSDKLYVDGKYPMGESDETLEFEGRTYTNDNSHIFIVGDIFGGNDVSGEVGLSKLRAYLASHPNASQAQLSQLLDGATLNIYGGNVLGNIYGAGNGTYLYTLDGNVKRVTPVENYTKGKVVYDLVYTVPMREELGNFKNASQTQKLLDINSFRPIISKTTINAKGNSSSDRLNIKGSIFGGGTTATVLSVGGSRGQVAVNVGNHVNIGNVFLGSDGDAMFDIENSYFSNFSIINEVSLSDSIPWYTDPGVIEIGVDYLPAKDLATRKLLYPNLLDLYFQPVEMDMQPSCTFYDLDTKESGDATIGVFCCGGNRGNMATLERVSIVFPEGLTIRDRIIGGCNKANLTINEGSANQRTHYGGYLLNDESGQPKIKLTVRNQFSAPAMNGSYYKQGSNVYGGCYETGDINGDVYIDIVSNMLENADAAALKASNENDVPVFNVYGAGYGMQSHVYGDVTINVGNNNADMGAGSMHAPMMRKSSRMTEDAVTFSGTTINNIYGGGQMGYLIGNSKIHLLNGQVFNNVVGGSYGYMYGNTQIMVGFPSYYRCEKSGKYALNRADSWHADLKNSRQSYLNNGQIEELSTVKNEIAILKGAFIPASVYDAIVAKDAAQSSNFTFVGNNDLSQYGLTWDAVNIKVGNAIYGGGYIPKSGESASVASYAIRPYDKEFNLDAQLRQMKLTDVTTTQGYGGNTTIIVGDQMSYGGNGVGTPGSRSHISITTKEGEGGLYGDGHLSFVCGFRAAELIGYGYANPVDRAQLLNTIQQLDLVRVSDCCMDLFGATDGKSSSDASQYSISRVGEFQMYSTIDYKGKNLAQSTASSYTDAEGHEYTVVTFPVAGRNYVGLRRSTNVLGAVVSNVDFNDGWHDEKGQPQASDTYYSYKEKSVYNHYAIEPHKDYLFVNRNNGTSPNMFGLSSGYALVVQNAQEFSNRSETKFYGPVIGVNEIRLINVHRSEGGGFVYAHNVHEDFKTVNGTYRPTFMETSGNFVFPVTEDRKVADDCFDETYDKTVLKEPYDAHNFEDCHYWYISGNEYVFNVTITGYTFDSQKEPLYFDAPSEMMVLADVRKENPVILKSIKWGKEKSHSIDGYSCDIQDPSKNYTLSFSIGDSETYDPTSSVKHVIDRGNDLPYSLDRTMASLNVDAPRISIQLKDAVNNSGLEYFKQHLADTCEVQLQFQVDKVLVLREDGEKDEVTFYYTVNLNIVYLEGPDYEGHIDIKNCALPGELIHLTSKGVKIYVDKQMGVVGDDWRLYYEEQPKSEWESDGEGGYKFASRWNTSKYYDLDYLKRHFGAKIDATTNDLYLPARYFMNGFGVQYFYQCNGVSDSKGNLIWMPVAMQDCDSLLVHNYHQMNYVNEHDLQIERAVTDGLKPRIYLEKPEDLGAFAQWLNNDSITKDVRFYLSQDLAMPYDYAVEEGKTFEGELHGNGHSVTTNGQKSQLLSVNGGKVYNLGVVGASLAGSNASGAEIHNSFSYDADVVSANSGLIDNCYQNFDKKGNATYMSDDHFANGRVAYQLNKYYLEYRAMKGLGTADLADNSAANKAKAAGFQYLLDYYADPDYRYAGYENAYNQDNYQHYLRTDINPIYPTDAPVDVMRMTAHDMNHPVDELRAVKVSAGNVHRLINGNEADFYAWDGATQAYLTDKCQDHHESEFVHVPQFELGDFHFFGQTVNTGAKDWGAFESDYPQAYLRNMTNRVYRASAYEGSKENVGLYFHTDVVVPLNATAVDLSYASDRVAQSGHPSFGYSLFDTPSKPLANSRGAFYAPMLDLPGNVLTGVENRLYPMLNPTEITSFQLRSRGDAEHKEDGTTQNLLVYTGTDVDHAREYVEPELTYTAATDTAVIRGHHVKYEYNYGANKQIQSVYSGIVHLVDAQDFNCPLAFSVADSAWYDRTPKLYAEHDGTGWEAIALPFTVRRVMASEHGEITHFYATEARNANTDNDNHHQVSHEYWLRGLTDQKDAQLTFMRPEKSAAKGFAHARQTAQAFNYYFDNSYLYNVSRTGNGPVNDGQAAFEYYRKIHRYEDYLPLTDNIPYLISYPGDYYYEFNLKGESITYSSVKTVESGVETGATTIPVTDDQKPETKLAGITYRAAFDHHVLTDSEYTLSADGSKFVRAEDQIVAPFRAYMVENAGSGAPELRIGDTRAISILDPEEDEQPEDRLGGSDFLEIHIEEMTLVVRSSKARILDLFAADGTLICHLKVAEGNNRYKLNRQGVYVVNQQKYIAL